jgi:hypothetical protein
VTQVNNSGEGAFDHALKVHSEGYNRLTLLMGALNHHDVDIKLEELWESFLFTGSM